jgi:hypothetical protein
MDKYATPDGSSALNKFCSIPAHELLLPMSAACLEDLVFASSLSASILLPYVLVSAVHCWLVKRQQCTWVAYQLYSRGELAAVWNVCLATAGGIQQTIFAIPR